MATGKIKKRSVEALAVPPKGKREHLWDDQLKGFGIMVTPNGVRSYIVQYRIGGRGAPTRRYTIGRHGSPWTAESARARAAEILELVRRRVDPVNLEREERVRAESSKADAAREQAIRERLAFNVIADRWIEKYAKAKQPRTWKSSKAVVDNDLTPKFSTTPVTDITDADIVEHLDTLGERAPSAARRAYTALRLIFAFACDKERRYFPKARNPMLNVSKPSSAGKRERSLNDQELRLFWLATGQIGYPFGAIWRLLALTALRKNEVAGVSFDEIDYEHDRWIIPGSRMKNKLNHLVPITTEMRNVFEGLPSPANERKLVFTKTGTRHVSGFSKAKDILDQMMLKVAQLEASHAGAKADQVEKISITPWVAHDLRRTFTSACGRMGIPLEHSEAVLSHRTFKSGLLGVYNVYEYEDEKRVTLEKWQAYIQRLVDEQPCAILDKIQTGRNA